MPRIRRILLRVLPWWRLHSGLCIWPSKRARMPGKFGWQNHHSFVTSCKLKYERLILMAGWRYLDGRSTLHRTRARQRGANSRILPWNSWLLFRWQSGRSVWIWLLDRTRHPFLLYSRWHLGALSNLPRRYKVPFRPFSKVNQICYFTFYRETRDGCDGCPGPFGGPRNRTAEGGSGGSSGSRRNNGPNQPAASTANTRRNQRPSSPAASVGNNRGNNNNRRNNNNNRRNNNRSKGNQNQRRPTGNSARPQRPQRPQKPQRPQAPRQNARPVTNNRRNNAPQQQSQPLQKSNAGSSNGNSRCPGGALEMCIDVCPSFSARIFGACVSGCAKRCPAKK